MADGRLLCAITFDAVFIVLFCALMLNKANCGESEMYTMIRVIFGCNTF